MLTRKVTCFGLIFMLGTMMCAAPVLAADESNMAGRVATWMKEYNAGNLDAVLALYASDGCRMPPHAPKVSGHEAILAQLQESKSNGPQVKLGLISAETIGDHGHASGTYEILGDDGSHLDHGKWTNTLQKLNGSWVIQCDIYNSDMPIPGAGK